MYCLVNVEGLQLDNLSCFMNRYFWGIIRASLRIPTIIILQPYVAATVWMHSDAGLFCSETIRPISYLVT